MKHLLPALVLSLAATLPAHAGPKGEALAACVADNTTGKDRKDLARWIFVAIAAHPEIKPLSNVSDQNRDDADDTVAKLLTALMTERCKVQAREAAQQEGSQAIVVAFQSLGELAMQELMSNPQVAAAMGNLERRIDRSKLATMMGGK